MSESRNPLISMDHDRETETFRAAFESRRVDPSIATVEVLARVCEAGPTEIQPLADVVDPEALDLICTLRTDSQHVGDRTVEFAYLGYTVRVKSSGIVEVERTA